jgi:hypothetical protein
MRIFDRGATPEDKLAWNDTVRTIVSPLAILVSGAAIVASVLLASCEAKRQTDAAREQRQADRAAEVRQAGQNFQLEAIQAVMAEPTCERAVEKAAMLTITFPETAAFLRTPISVLERTSDEPADICSVERLTELASPP